MLEFISIFSNVVLLLVIISQMADKVITGREHNKEINKLTGALMSKNVFEYESVLKTADKKPEPAPPQEPEEVDLSTADDEVFDKHVGIKK